jgi:spore coat polysaccharide biosynthesis predicted glycosyltransferase SpsG
VTGAVAFWADAGPGVGLGHVARCSAIALELQALGGHPAFTVPDSAGADYARTSGLYAVVASAGFREFAARTPHGGAAVVDSYRVDAPMLAALRARGVRVAALDDTATSVPLVDLVINGAPGAERLGYPPRVGTEYLLGPRYFPLRSAFRAWPEKIIADRVARVLVTAGGEDVHDLLGLLMASASIVFGGARVVGVCATAPRSAVAGDLRIAPRDYPELVRAADVIVCGGGQTLIEAIATGTPAAALLLGSDQHPQLSAITAAGAAVAAGSWDTDRGRLDRQLRTALEGLRDRAVRAELSRRGRSLIDGEGAARVAAAVLRLASAAGVEQE